MDAGGAKPTHGPWRGGASMRYCEAKSLGIPQVPLEQSNSAIAISAKLLQARENDSAGMLKIGPHSKAVNTADRNARLAKPISTFAIADIPPPPCFATACAYQTFVRFGSDH